MTFQPSSTTGVHALDQSQLQASDNGYSVKSGCAVSLSSATTTTPIEVVVDPGIARFDHLITSIADGTYSITDGSADPRWDAVCVTDDTGTISIVEGVPGPVMTDSSGAEIRGRPAYTPSPNDSIGANKTCLAIVWVPENATTNDDLRADVNEPVIDRRHEARASTGMGADLLDTYDDQDTSTSFTYTSGTFDRTYDEYIVLCRIAGQGTGSAAAAMNVRVNDNFNSNYFYNSLAASGTARSTNENGWRDVFRDNRSLHFGWAIQGHDLPTEGSAARHTTIQSLRGGDSSVSHLINGRQTDNISVSSIDVRTNATITAKLAVYGRDLF